MVGAISNPMSIVAPKTIHAYNLNNRHDTSDVLKFSEYALSSKTSRYYFSTGTACGPYCPVCLEAEAHSPYQSPLEN
ncbi:hypothetical protein CEXT_105891 [Caerostris extrusa]|uniref:Uncharacterized protein n=1 Tax=Caerostris extrusa TaxID=172846 RepID=A0AAV4UMX2_CAEEX|nr:hypothetical protein CEXT_105891 [Caerostris extrusa]